jgi:hypothetical protein
MLTSVIVPKKVLKKAAAQGGAVMAQSKIGSLRRAQGGQIDPYLRLSSAA